MRAIALEMQTSMPLPARRSASRPSTTETLVTPHRPSLRRTVVSCALDWLPSARAPPAVHVQNLAGDEPAWSVQRNTIAGRSPRASHPPRGSWPAPGASSGWRRVWTCRSRPSRATQFTRSDGARARGEPFTKLMSAPLLARSRNGGFRRWPARSSSPAPLPALVLPLHLATACLTRRRCCHGSRPGAASLVAISSTANVLAPDPVVPDQDVQRRSAGPPPPTSRPGTLGVAQTRLDSAPRSSRTRPLPARQTWARS